MSGVMLNFKGKMYKLCEKKDMDRKPNKKPVEVDRKIRSDKGGKHTKAPAPAKKAPALKDVKKVLAKVKKNMDKAKPKAPAPKDVKKVLAKVKKNMDKAKPKAPAPAKKAPAKKTRSDKGGKHSGQKYKVLPSGRRVKHKDGKTAKQLKVEGFPSFKGDEPRAKEEKRRDNSLY